VRHKSLTTINPDIKTKMDYCIVSFICFRSGETELAGEWMDGMKNI
jgi:hypothetical protein